VISGPLQGASITQQSSDQVIVQDNNFDATASITVCAFATREADGMRPIQVTLDRAECRRSGAIAGVLGAFILMFPQSLA
jgi:hypothetical protein